MANEMTLQTGASDWQAMKEQAKVLLISGFLPPSIKTPEQALSIALAGRELGIGFMESIRSINVIQGKPTISPQLMLARAYQTKEVDDVKIDSTDTRCVVTIKRKGKTPITNEFGEKEATSLGLMSKDNYRKQPKTMFMWRALAANLRVTFPDVTSGLYTPEELGANVAIGENETMEITEAPSSGVNQSMHRKPEEHRVELIESSLDRPITEDIPIPIQDSKPSELPLNVMKAEIEDWLGVIYQGDARAMSAHLKSITTWKTKDGEAWLDLPTLKHLKENRKGWIKKIHELVSRSYDEFAAKKG